MSTFPAILDPRKAWLAERRTMLTASDCAAVLGVDPWRGPFAVYADKVGEIETPDNAVMRRGRRLEAAIAEEYTEETRRRTINPGDFVITKHPEISWLGATIDRLSGLSMKYPSPDYPGKKNPEVDYLVPLELKAVTSLKAHDWIEDPPEHYQVQLQIQMACCGTPWGSLAALLGGLNLVWVDLARDDAFLKVAIPRLEAFWQRVQRRDPPPADGLPATTTAIKALWPQDDGQTMDLDQSALAVANRIDDLKIQRKHIESALKEAENHIKTLMGASTFGTLPDGSLLTLKTTHRAGYTVKPTEFRTLRRARRAA